jgi:hypothetical protein
LAPFRFPAVGLILSGRAGGAAFTRTAAGAPPIAAAAVWPWQITHFDQQAICNGAAFT